MSDVAENLIKLNNDGKFECAECANVAVPNTNTVNGIEPIDHNIVLDELKEFPNKLVYAICPVCGMEYQVKLVDDQLYLEESEELK